MKQRHFAALVIACAFLLAACGGREGGRRAADATGNELVIAFDGSPTNLDPRIGTDSYSGRIWDMAASGLIRFTPSGDFIDDIAERWETPDDRTIIFHLKPNARFQDGRPVTARDFKFTFDSMMADDFNSPKKSGYASVAAFEAPDDRTFVVRLSEPNAGIFDNFPYMLVPEGANPDEFAKQPVLAGAYRVADFRTDERVTLNAFNEWVNGQPNIPRVVVRIIPDATTRVLELRRGTVNFAINSIPLDQVGQFRNNSDFKIETSPGGAYQYLAFNLRDPILRKKEVRKAIAHAIDRERIVRDLLHGYGSVTETIFPPGHWARAGNLPAHGYDPQRAMQLLDQAGHRDPDGQQGPQSRFRLVFRTSADAEANQQAEIIQQMLREVGVDMQIQSTEFGTFMEDVRNGRFQMFSLRRAGVSDPDFYHTIFHSSSLAPVGQNRGYYINRRVDQLIEQGRSTFDRQKRKAAYEEIQRILADELPYVSLYHRDNVAVMRRNVEGFEMYPSGFLLSVPKMTIR
ncbi:MAG TPA: ABC transporter substrate-binding protein [Thermoanaerobaculia bacterium]|nr:ABC transporter substrate-binding protein [Thermoanaerobaculia bacterium]